MAIVRDYPGCVFDFSGGRDMLLLMAGSCLLERSGLAFFIDVLRERFINIQFCEGICRAFYHSQSFTAEEIFAMQWGYHSQLRHFPQSKIDKAFEEDVLAVFPKDLAISGLGRVCVMASGFLLGHTLQPAGCFWYCWLKTKQTKSGVNPVLLRRLVETGVITHCEVGHSKVELTFKSSLLRSVCWWKGCGWSFMVLFWPAAAVPLKDARTSLVVDWGNGGGRRLQQC